MDALLLDRMSTRDEDLRDTVAELRELAERRLHRVTELEERVRQLEKALEE